jgi:hypothetical protein
MGNVGGELKGKRGVAMPAMPYHATQRNKPSTARAGGADAPRSTFLLPRRASEYNTCC